MSTNTMFHDLMFYYNEHHSDIMKYKHSFSTRPEPIHLDQHYGDGNNVIENRDRCNGNDLDNNDRDNSDETTVIQNILERIENTWKQRMNTHNFNSDKKKRIMDKLSKQTYADYIDKRLYGKLTPETECPISSHVFTPKDHIIQLPCLHIFTENSISEWLYEYCIHAPICPVCKQSL